MNGSATPEAFFIGVDGGGSRCRVRIVDAVGRVVGEAEGGSANVYLDFERSLATIESSVAKACATVDVARPHSIALGLAGAASPEIAARVAVRMARPARRITVSNDAVIACIGAHAGRDGGLVIAGTGSAALLRLAGREDNFGGRGFVLGDDGSGAVMGRQAWRRALRAQDGLEPWTPLLRELMGEFGGDVGAVIGWGRTATSGSFARFAPRIIDAARNQDAAAMALVEDSALAVGELILALKTRGSPRTSLVGGLAGPLRPFLPEAARAHLSPPLRDALDGALLQAGAPLSPAA